MFFISPISSSLLLDTLNWFAARLEPPFNCRWMNWALSTQSTTTMFMLFRKNLCLRKIQCRASAFIHFIAPLDCTQRSIITICLVEDHLGCSNWPPTRAIWFAVLVINPRWSEQSLSCNDLPNCDAKGGNFVNFSLNVMLLVRESLHWVSRCKF